MKLRFSCWSAYFTLVFGIVALPQFAIAQFGFTAASSIEYIENPQRLGSSYESELLSSTTLSAALLRQTKYFDTNLNYSANRQEYQEDLLNDQSRVEGNGSITWKAIPDLFSWQFSNMRSNQLVDASQPDISDNRQIIDYTSTGPVIFLPLGNSTFVNIAADFGTVGYEQSRGLEQNRNSYSLNVTRALTQRLTGSLSSSYTTVDYNNPFLSAYTFLNFAANLQFSGEDYSLSADIGESQSKVLGRSSRHPMFILSALYRVNSQLELSGNYSIRVDDLISNLGAPSIVDQFFQDSSPELGDTFGNSNISNSYERESHSIGATYTIESMFSVNLRYTNNQRASIGAAGEENDERLSVNLILPFPQQPRLTINSSVQLSKRNFSAARGIQDRTNLRVGANYKLTNKLNLTFSTSNVEQSGSFPSENFEGQNISLGLTFTR